MNAKKAAEISDAANIAPLDLLDQVKRGIAFSAAMGKKSHKVGNYSSASSRAQRTVIAYLGKQGFKTVFSRDALVVWWGDNYYDVDL